MIVVADTGPLNYLARLNLIDLILPRLYNEVIIPPAVASELSNVRAPAEVRSLIIDGRGWLHVRELTQAPPTMPKVDPREREAIQLAIELQSLLLCDDLRGRRAAEQFGLSTTGTLGVLRDAAKLDLIDIRASFDRLKTFGFFASDEVLFAIVTEVDSHRQP